MSVETAADISAELRASFEPDERVCEHKHHADPRAVDVHGGAATHWATTNHPCFGPTGIAFPVCTVYAEYILGKFDIKSCTWCGGPVTDLRIIGTIGGAL
jgi:hypothetical protein